MKKGDKIIVIPEGRSGTVVSLNDESAVVNLNGATRTLTADNNIVLSYAPVKESATYPRTSCAWSSAASRSL